MDVRDDEQAHRTSMPDRDGSSALGGNFLLCTGGVGPDPATMTTAAQQALTGNPDSRSEPRPGAAGSVTVPAREILDGIGLSQSEMRRARR